MSRLGRLTKNPVLGHRTFALATLNQRWATGRGAPCSSAQIPISLVHDDLKLCPVMLLDSF